MQIIETQCKNILTRACGYLGKVCSHSLNPYTGCGFGRSACGVGCYAQFNHWLTKGRAWGSFVEVKVNAADVYRRTAERERKWARGRGRPFAVFFSSSTDPWQPAESTYRLTRSLLAAMRECPPDLLVLQTHTARGREDLPLIAELSRACELRVQVSVEGDVERLPGLPPPACSLEERLRFLGECAATGLTAVACLSPLYPMRDPDRFFARLVELGVAAAVIDHFIEGDGTPDGARTLRTGLPRAMAAVAAESTELAYRARIVEIARSYLPTGVSCAGFGGEYLPLVQGRAKKLAAGC